MEKRIKKRRIQRLVAIFQVMGNGDWRVVFSLKLGGCRWTAQVA